MISFTLLNWIGQPEIDPVRHVAKFYGMCYKNMLALYA
jgi:hypothetical protein